MSRTADVAIMLYWSTDTKSWIAVGQIAGVTVASVRWETAFHGAPTTTDVRQLVQAIQDESQSWLF